MEYRPLLSKTSGNKPSTYKLFLAACAVGIGGAFQYGYNVSIINAPTTYIQTFINDTWHIRHKSNLDGSLLTLIWSVIVSIFTLGGLLGTYIGGTMAVKLGRKKTLLMNNIIAMFAAFFMGLAEPAGLFELLIVGRFLIGINAGIGICVQPLYLGEIAPKQIRGFMTVGINIFLTGGLLAGQIVGLREVLGDENSWPFLLATCCIPAFIQLLTFPFFPESPRYLLIEKKDEYGCQKALKTFYGTQHYQLQMEDIQVESNALRGEKPKTILELFSDQTIKWQLIAIIVTNIGQQLCGINAIYFYADYVFTKAGIPAPNIPYVTLGTGACECVTALTCKTLAKSIQGSSVQYALVYVGGHLHLVISVIIILLIISMLCSMVDSKKNICDLVIFINKGLLIDKAGRRLLIIGGYTLMAFWCAILTLTLTFQDLFSWVPYLSMSAILAFILCFGLGPGGVTNTLTAELFTQSARSSAFMIGGSVNWISFFAIGLIFPFIVDGLNQFCFLFFFVVCILIAGFIFCIVPETKNKSFLDIKADFHKLNFGQLKSNSIEDHITRSTEDTL